MTTDTVQDAHARFYEALNSTLQGDPASMRAIWSQGADITLMGPFGNRLVGSDAVLGQFEEVSRMNMGGRIVPVDAHIVATGDMGYSICVEHGEDTTAGSNPVEVEHRATNVFRREQDGWRMVHHHTDLTPALNATAE